MSITASTTIAGSSGTTETSPLLLALLPITSAVFIVFFVIGMAMPVLPLHIHERLGLGAFVVGLVAGSQFAASLVSRFWAGHSADSRGSKRAMLIGMATAALAGVVYLLSLPLIQMPGMSATVLLAGRGVLGAAESFVITGALSWGLALGGPAKAGKVIAWLGLPMYAAFAIGAPVGSWLYAQAGFGGIALATLIAPLAGLLLIAPLTPLAPSLAERPSPRSIVGAVAVPGLGLALSSVGFGAVTIFISLLFAGRGWPQAWLAFTALGVLFILARVVFGHLPDRLGGTRVALLSVAVEALGLALIWLAPAPLWAFVGAGLTGFGYSLVYPSFGVEAVRRAPAESRGLVMGAYTACLDLGLGIAGPTLGIIAAHGGNTSVFLVSAVVVLMAAGVALALGRRPTAIRSPSQGA